MAVVLAGASLHRLRVNILSKRQALAEELRLALERARLAKDMHDDVGSSLTQIGLLSDRAKRDLARPEAAALDIERISATVRQTALAIEQIFWTVDSSNDTLENLATYLTKSVSEYLQIASIQCRLDIPEILPDLTVLSGVRHNLLSLVKEALNNVVKHSAATEVSLSLRLDGHTLTLTVRDNGRGFVPKVGTRCRVSQETAIGLSAERSTSNSQPEPNGNGLTNMRERIESLGGQFNLESAPGQGTKLTAVIKLKESG